jgi:hypothetical protein
MQREIATDIVCFFAVAGRNWDKRTDGAGRKHEDGMCKYDILNLFKFIFLHACFRPRVKAKNIVLFKIDGYFTSLLLDKIETQLIFLFWRRFYYVEKIVVQIRSSILFYGCVSYFITDWIVSYFVRDLLSWVFIYVFLFSFVPLNLATHCVVLEGGSVSDPLQGTFRYHHGIFIQKLFIIQEWPNLILR